MKLTEKEILANRIFGENADEVLKFLAKVAPNKAEFRNEHTFLNFVARKLEPMLKKKALNCEQKATYWKNLSAVNDPNLKSKFSFEELQERFEKSKQNAVFWSNRAISMDIKNQVNKAKNVLWYIRLLDEKCGAPKD